MDEMASRIGQVAALLGGGDLAGASALAQALAQEFPHDYRPFFFWGDALRRLGDNGGAIAPLGRALELNPASGVVNQAAGFARLALGDNEAGLALLRAAITADPTLTDAQFTLAVQLRRLNQPEALVLLRDLDRKLPGNASVLENLAVALYQWGELAEAETTFRTLLALKPASEYEHSLALVLIAQGKKAEAADLLAQAVRAGRATFAMVEPLFVLLRELERLDEGVDLCRHLLAAEPGHAEYLHQLALLLRDQGKTDEAVAAFTQACTATPDAAHILGNFGLFLRRCMRYGEAEPYLRRAVELMPDTQEVAYALASLLHDTGRWGEADAIVRGFIERNGGGRHRVKRSVVVPVLDYSPNSPWDITTLLDDLKDFDGEVICVFNGDQVFHDLKDHPRIDKYSYNKFNMGVSRAWNVGINQAEGDTIFILNADLHVQLETLSEMERQLHALPDALGVGVWGYFHDPATGQRKVKLDPGTYAEPTAVDEIPGHAFALHAQRLHDHGISFDPRLAPFCYEEQDLAIKARQHGLKLYALPVDGIEHVWGISMNDRPIHFFNRLVNRVECMISNARLISEKRRRILGIE